jgi:hypothetical protein
MRLRAETPMTAKKSFKAWLLAQDKRTGPVGDIARDFGLDFKDSNRKPGEPVPPRPFTPESARAYLERKGLLADGQAGPVEALEEAIGEWRAE